jgi:hypothetical protein
MWTSLAVWTAMFVPVLDKAEENRLRRADNVLPKNIDLHMKNL